MSGHYYPPQCVTCSQFVKVATARRICEYGDFGVLINVEFECERCVAERQLLKEKIL